MSKATLVCIWSSGHRFNKPGNEWTTWATPEEGVEALRELCIPVCGPRCQAVHLVAWLDDDTGARRAEPPAPCSERPSSRTQGDETDRPLDTTGENVPRPDGGVRRV